MANLPNNLRVYAVGDIHGCADLLTALLAFIAEEERSRPPAASKLVFLGDYIDRGPDSFGVIEALLHGLPTGFAADFLMGNHERMLLDALADESTMPQWLANGGGAVIEAYAEAARRRGDWAGRWSGLGGLLPVTHRQFFENLKPWVEYGDYLFVHAGLWPGVALDRQDPHDLLWIRKPFLDYQGSFGKMVVHGHTPVVAPEIHENRIAIDTGAVFTGKLTALVLEAGRRDFLST